MIMNLSVPAYGFSLKNEVRCTMCGGVGKIDAPVEARQGLVELTRQAFLELRWRRGGGGG